MTWLPLTKIFAIAGRDGTHFNSSNSVHLQLLVDNTLLSICNKLQQQIKISFGISLIGAIILPSQILIRWPQSCVRNALRSPFDRTPGLYYANGHRGRLTHSWWVKDCVHQPLGEIGLSKFCSPNQK